MQYRLPLLTIKSSIRCEIGAMRLSFVSTSAWTPTTSPARARLTNRRLVTTYASAPHRIAPCACTAMPPSRPVAAEPDPSPTTVDIGHLLAACVDAAERACAVIRGVQAAREAGRSIGASLKDVADPRSALTVADTLAQASIVGPLARDFPGLTIIGEEDLREHDELKGSELADVPPSRTACKALKTPEALRAVLLSEVTVFVDPMDGTKEYVDGRLEAVCTLIGISVGGRAMAGAIGRPFHPDSGIVHAIVGAGVANLVPAAAKASSGGGLILASSVSPKHPVIRGAQRVISPARILAMGGAANKMLQVATGAADVALLNLVTSLWDSCATEAVIVACGGRVTDLFGSRIQHDATTRICNCYGVLASSAGLNTEDTPGRSHKDICSELRNSTVVDPLLADIGLVPSFPDERQATDIARDLDGNPLTADWLSGVLGFPIESYSAPCGVRYLMSDACRIELKRPTSASGVEENDCSTLQDDSSEPRAPRSLFLKRIVMADLPHVLLKSRTAPVKLARDVTSYQVEAAFLASRACARFIKAGASIARPYHVELRPAATDQSPIESKFMLLLKDFSPRDGWCQVGLLGADEMLACLSSLADLHAFFWNFQADDDYEELSESVWQNGSYWAPSRQAPDLHTKIAACWERHRGNFATELEAAGVRGEGSVTLDNLGSVLQRHAVDVAQNSHRAGSDTSHPHRSFIHGDAKAANFFFRSDKESDSVSVGMIDFQWSGFGNPAVDVAYLILSSAHRSLVSYDGKLELALLEHYHARLLQSFIRFGKARSIADATKLLSFSELHAYYNDAFLDLACLIMSYHWARISASPTVLESRKEQLGSNAYNKNCDIAVWFIARTASLLNARESACPS